MPLLESIIAKFKADGLELSALPALVAELESEAAAAEAAHTQELGIRDAKVSSLTEDLGRRDADIKDLKVKNYDLVMGAATPPAGGKDAAGNGGEDADGDDGEAEGPTIDALFESRK